MVDNSDDVTEIPIQMAVGPPLMMPPMMPPMPIPAPMHPNAPQYPAYPTLPGAVSHENPDINKTVNDLLAMGFTNEGGWLTRLVESKQGDINAALNVLLRRQ